MTDTSHRRDQVGYDQQQVEALLPACWDDEFGILAARAEQEIRSNGDPAHGGGLMAMVADVRRAYSALHKLDHELLWARYHHQLSLTAIAELGGYESEQEVADELERVVGEIIGYLGGRR